MISLFLFLIYHVFASKNVAADATKMICDFTRGVSLDDWHESSDNVREVGMSKATLVLQRTQVFQRAVFFTLLNPQPNGAGFAGMNRKLDLNLTDYHSLAIHLRGQGKNSGYKIVLRHRNENREPFPTYEQTFTAPMESFETITLPLADFKPYYRGKPLNETAPPLDKSFITSLGLQIYGGVYLPKKQSGVSSLEIDWIKAI